MNFQNQLKSGLTLLVLGAFQFYPQVTRAQSWVWKCIGDPRDQRVDWALHLLRELEKINRQGTVGFTVPIQPVACAALKSLPSGTHALQAACRQAFVKELKNTLEKNWTHQRTLMLDRNPLWESLTPLLLNSEQHTNPLVYTLQSLAGKDIQIRRNHQTEKRQKQACICFQYLLQQSEEIQLLADWIQHQLQPQSLETNPLNPPETVWKAFSLLPYFPYAPIGQNALEKAILSLAEVAQKENLGQVGYGSRSPITPRQIASTVRTLLLRAYLPPLLYLADFEQRFQVAQNLLSQARNQYARSSGHSS